MEQVKRDFFHTEWVRPEKVFETLRFEICHIVGEIQIGGYTRKEVFEFLKDYFKDFKSESEKAPDFVIRYKESPFNTELINPEWYDSLEEFLVSPDSNGHWIEQRDFYAFANPDWTQIDAVGFGVGDDNTDPIDNLVMVAMSRHLSRSNSIAVHAASVAHKGMAYIFYGVSGAGKSTLAEQSASREGKKVLSGDQIFIESRKDGTLWAHPTSTTIPEIGRESQHWQNSCLPVRAMIHLRPSPREFALTKIPLQEAMPKFLKQIFYWKEFGPSEQLTDIVLSSLMSCHNSLYEMTYKKGEDLWDKIETNL